MKLKPHRFDVSVQEANRVDALDSLQDLPAKPERGGRREGTVAHGAPQVGQVPSLQSHIVKGYKNVEQVEYRCAAPGRE